MGEGKYRCGAVSSDRVGTALQPGHFSLWQSPFGAAPSLRPPHLPRCPRTQPWSSVASPFGHTDGCEKPFGAAKKTPFERPNKAGGGGCVCVWWWGEGGVGAVLPNFSSILCAAAAALRSAALRLCPHRARRAERSRVCATNTHVFLLFGSK